MMLGTACHYMHYLQCQSRDRETWRTCSNIHRAREGILLSQQSEYKFWFCPDDIKHCVSGSKNKYVLDWPIVPNTWPVKIGTKLSREEILALEDV